MSSVLLLNVDGEHKGINDKPNLYKELIIIVLRDVESSAIHICNDNYSKRLPLACLSRYENFNSVGLWIVGKYENIDITGKMF